MDFHVCRAGGHLPPKSRICTDHGNMPAAPHAVLSAAPDDMKNGVEPLPRVIVAR
jgi:hypothetical protein